jgi:hypothetical protein
VPLYFLDNMSFSVIITQKENTRAAALFSGEEFWPGRRSYEKMGKITGEPGPAGTRLALLLLDPPAGSDSGPNSL